MVKRLFEKGKKLFLSPQGSILSAAMIIMLMIIASRVLGLVRQRVLAHFFTASELSLFFAAFRLPDTVFEVLVFGTFSSAFIPVFTRLIKKDEKDAWRLASSVVNIGLLVFTILAIVVSFAAKDLYQIFAPGYSLLEREKIVFLTRILFLAQGFFVVSYVLTGVLESMKRFLIPALAPIFYNLGIILGACFLSEKMLLTGPAIGVFIGALSHFLIQLPLAVKLGFRFKPKIEIDEDVKKIGRLALPRVIEVSFTQLSKMTELYFASLIQTASYAYYTFGNTLQLLPVGLFGISIAKASLPTLSALAEKKEDFLRVLRKTLFEMTFLITPFAALLIVLRIPVVRLVYGTDIFTWESTVQTGMVVSAFSLGIIFQATSALLARGFYAIHDTKTPVIVSIVTILISIFLDWLFIRILGTPVWGLAMAFSIGSMFQSIVLYFLIMRRMAGAFVWGGLVPFGKHILSSSVAGLVMFFFLKFFDRSVWVKRLSFLGQIEITKNIPFQRFVLDTRYTVNLLILTVIVGVIGIIIYLEVSILLRTKEVNTFFSLAKKIFVKREVGHIPEREKESIIPPAGETNN